MMADLRLSSKPSKNSQKRIFGSLALRVLLISLLLVAIPLLIHNFIIYLQDYRLKMRELFSHYEVLGQTQARLISDHCALRGDELEAISAFLNFSENSSFDNSLSRIVQEQSLSTLFYLSLETDGTTVCKTASLAALIGQKNLFKEQIAKAVSEDVIVFSALNPFTHQEEIFVSKVIFAQNLPSGVLVLSESAKDLMQNLILKQPDPLYSLALLTQEDTLIVSTNPSFSLTNIEVLTSLDWEEKIGFFQRFKEKKERIGTKVQVSETSFVLLIDFPEKLLQDVHSEEFFSRLTTLFLLILFVGGAGTLWITFRMSRPLKSLSQDMQRMGEGDLDVRFKKDPLGFEINDLGMLFNEMAGSLQHHIKEAEKERMAKELFRQELEIGHRIQQNLFPREFPHVKGVEVGSGFLPAKEVAGDFYDLFAVSEKRQEFMFSIADGSGKGISACLYSLLVRSMLRSFYSSSSDLLKIVQLTNDLLCQDTKDSGFFVTAWMGIFDADKRRLHYSCCGHPPGILIRKTGEIEELYTQGMAWGVMEPGYFSTATLELSSGDLLLLYTDGVTEAHDPAGKQWGKAAFIDALKESKDASAQRLIDELFAKLAAFTKEAPQHDDLTFLAVKIL